MSTRSWFSARCLFQHEGLAVQPGCAAYEERIIVLRASSLSEAVSRAEIEAREYAARSRAAFLGHTIVYDLTEEKLAEGTEVFSLMRESPLLPEEFVRRYYADGTERAGSMNE